MPGELVAKDGDPVDCSTRLEMCLELFRSRAVIDLGAKNAEKICWLHPSQPCYDAS
jgi:hypothetical protein